MARRQQELPTGRVPLPIYRPVGEQHCAVEKHTVLLEGEKHTVLWNRNTVSGWKGTSWREHASHINQTFMFWLIIIICYQKNGWRCPSFWDRNWRTRNLHSPMCAMCARQGAHRVHTIDYDLLAIVLGNILKKKFKSGIERVACLAAFSVRWHKCVALSCWLGPSFVFRGVNFFSLCTLISVGCVILFYDVTLWVLCC